MMTPLNLISMFSVALLVLYQAPICSQTFIDVEKSSVEESYTKHAEIMSKELLTDIFKAHHPDVVDQLVRSKLTPDQFKSFFDDAKDPEWNLKNPSDKILEFGEFKTRLIAAGDDSGKLKSVYEDFVLRNKRFNTIAVDIDPSTRTILVAGNIYTKRYNFENDRVMARSEAPGLTGTDTESIQRVLQSPEFANYKDYEVIMLQSDYSGFRDAHSKISLQDYTNKYLENKMDYLASSENRGRPLTQPETLDLKTRATEELQTSYKDENKKYRMVFDQVQNAVLNYDSSKLKDMENKLLNRKRQDKLKKMSADEKKQLGKTNVLTDFDRSQAKLAARKQYLSTYWKSVYSAVIEKMGYSLHAEMAIDKYKRAQGLDGTQEYRSHTQASKAKCGKCYDAMETSRLTYFKNEEEAPDSGNKKPKNWAPPETELYKIDQVVVKARPVEIDEAWTGRVLELAQDDADVKKTADSVAKLLPCGRKRRSVGAACPFALKDYVDTDAQKVLDLDAASTSDSERRHILSIVDEIGVQKLQGSPESIKKVKDKVKGFKRSVVEGVKDLVKTGGLIVGLMGPSTKAQGLDKVSISPQLLAESIANGYQDQELFTSKRIEEEGGKTGEYDSTSSSREPRAGKRKFHEKISKVAKWVNIGMIGKDFLGSALEGDVDSIAKLAGIVVGGKLLDKFGDVISKAGTKIATTGKVLSAYSATKNLGKHLTRIGNVAKVAGPIVGSGMVGFNIYNLHNNVQNYISIKKECKKMDKLFQERFESDCQIDTDVALVSVVEESVNVALSVTSTVIEIMALFFTSSGVLAPLGVIVAVLDIALSIGFGIYKAVKAVEKIDRALVSGLESGERFETGLRIFFGMGPPAHIQKLMDTKESWNKGLAEALGFLENQTQYATIVRPTAFQSEVNCKYKWKIVSRVLLDIFSLGFAEIAFSKDPGPNDSPTTKTCDNIQVLNKHSHVDFRSKRTVNGYRVVPDRPSKGALECNPNFEIYSPWAGEAEVQIQPESARIRAEVQAKNIYFYNQTYEGPQLHRQRVQNSFLCYNVIAATVPNRPNGAVLFNLEDGVDIAYGFPNKTNIFHIQHGPKIYIGGAREDIFLLTSYPFMGFLDGGSGAQNSLIVLDGATPTNALSASYGVGELSGSFYYSEWSNYTISKTLDFVDLDLRKEQLKNLQRVEGRRDLKDRVITACDTSYVNLKGGQSEGLLDEIIIPAREDCNQSLQVLIQKFTAVKNEMGRMGSSFMYQVSLEGRSSLSLLANNQALNVISITNSIQEASVVLDKPGNDVIIRDGIKSFTTTYIPNTETYRLLTNGGVVIKFDPEGACFGFCMITNHTQVKQRLEGLRGYPNQFVALDGAPWVELFGGDKDNTFFLQGGTGSLQGGLGQDALLLWDSFQASSPMDMIISPDGSGSLGFGSERLWSFTGIKSVVGREGLPDKVEVTCGLNWLDLKGGSAELYDDIIFTSDTSCAQDGAFNIIMQNFTALVNNATAGSFVYHIDPIVPSSVSTIDINWGSEAASGAVHTFLIKRNMSDVERVNLFPKTPAVQIDFAGGESWFGNASMPNVNIITADNMKLQLMPHVAGIITASMVRPEEGKGYQGLRNYPNIFFLDTESNEVTWFGGNEEDLFVLQGSIGEGEVHGGSQLSRDTILLQNSFWPEHVLQIDMQRGSIYSDSSSILTFSNISTLIGRESGVEAVIVDCSTDLVDLKGTSENGTDYIQVPLDYDCFYNLKISISPELRVWNQATRGNFSYQGELSGEYTALFLGFGSDVSHEISFDFDFPSLEDMVIQEGFIRLKRNGAWFSVNFKLMEGQDFQTKPKISFQDGLQLKIGRYSNHSLYIFGEIINSRRAKRDLAEDSKYLEYKIASKRLQASTAIRVQDFVYSFGAGGAIDVITAVPGYRNLLVSNSGNMTVFRVGPGGGDTAIMWERSGKIEDADNLLDLSQIVQNHPELHPNISVFHDGLRFTIQEKQIDIWNVNISDGDLQSWQVLLDAIFLDITCEGFDCRLSSKPIVLDPKENELVFLHPSDLDAGRKVIIRNESELILQPIKMENHLVLSNMFQDDGLDETISVTIFDYYEEGVAEALEAKNASVTLESGDVLVVLSKSIGDEVPLFEDRTIIFRYPNPLWQWLLHFGTTVVVPLGVIALITWMLLKGLSKSRKKNNKSKAAREPFVFENTPGCKEELQMLTPGGHADEDFKDTAESDKLVTKPSEVDNQFEKATVPTQCRKEIVVWKTHPWNAPIKMPIQYRK